MDTDKREIALFHSPNLGLPDGTEEFLGNSEVRSESVDESRTILPISCTKKSDTQTC